MKFESLNLELGTPAPDFLLRALDGKPCTFADVAGTKGTLVAFICNHCPFVLHILDEFVRYARDYQPRGLGVVAISSNDVVAHPEDSPEHMAALARERGFTFPYLYDESQDVAKAFKAVCTPDFFLYDANRRLAYCGQFDDSRPRTPFSTGPRTELPVTGGSLRAATDAVLAGRPVPSPQRPSNGCSMKWKAGTEPEWS